MSEILTQSGAVLQSDFLDSFFQKGELIPAIVQESGSKEVLMLAYMNRESLQKTLETGYTWFYSRSRQELTCRAGGAPAPRRAAALPGSGQCPPRCAR